MNIANKIKNTVFMNSCIRCTPHYFISVMQWSYWIIILYFLAYTIFIVYFGLSIYAVIITPWLLSAITALFFIHRLPGRRHLFLYTILLLSWLIFFVINFGWDCGGQHFIMPLMIIVFFSIYDTIPRKLLFLGLLFALRLYLFFYCMNNTPIIELTVISNAVLQIMNTSFVFIHMAMVCLIFSTNIQKAEKQLMVYNQELQKQACTDPLTALHNRRYMLDVLENQTSVKPHGRFCVALGDIDLFKKINDTRGHNFGDQVLKELAILFKNKTSGKGYVCRWGGEEFFFFLPGMNLDEASEFMNDLNIAVSKLSICDNGEPVHVTMTFGVEEYDYQSNLNNLIKNADDKLYYGKKNGRNRVIF